jgi:hypothetical protein
MDTALHFINAMNKEEIRFYKIYAQRISYNEERKDLALLDWFRKGKGAENEEEFIEKHYGLENKNAYYRLKNRLLEELCESMVLQHQDKDDVLQLLNLCSLVKIFIKKQAFELALHFLRKAEKKATAIEQYELLDFIYADYIKLSHELMRINPAEIISKRKENSSKLNQIKEMDDLLALVSYHLKISQNYNVATEELLDKIEQIIQKENSNKSLEKSTKFKTRLYGLLSQLFLQKHDYKSLESYSEQTFKAFEKEQLFNRNNHELKLQMVTYVMNAAFKNQNTSKSLQYAALLNELMNEYDAVLRPKFEVFYFNALVNNYTLTDTNKAIRLLEELLDAKKFAHLPFYDLFLQLNLATCYFDQNAFHKASRQITRTMIADEFKKADPHLQLKVNLTDLIVRCELEDYDFLKHRIEQVSKDFRSLLPEKLKERDLLNILNQCAKHAIKPNDKKVIKLTEQFLENYKSDQIDNELINVIDWLKSKIKKR